MENTIDFEPISCELSENDKNHLEVLEWVNKEFEKLIFTAFRIPKELVDVENKQLTYCGR